MKTPLLLAETEFHQLSRQFSLPKILPSMAEASRRLEMLWRSRAPFPNPLDSKQYLNRYIFRPGQPAVVWRDGRPTVDAVRFFLASVDLTFVRHIAAPFYRMRNWQPIHDPPILYGIHLWKTVEGLHHEEAIEILRHRRRGLEVCEMLGLTRAQVPKTYTVLTRFLERLGDEGMFKITRGFFWLLAQAGLLTGDIYLAIDGQLVPTFSCYHGCNRFQVGCARMQVSAQAMRAAVVQTLEKLAPQWPTLAAIGISSQRHLVSLPCPDGVTVQKGKRLLDVRLGWLRVFPLHERGFGPDQAPRLGIQSDWLRQQGLGIRLEALRLDLDGPGPYPLRCPRYPADPSVRIGWKNSNQPDGDPEPVFGVDMEQITLQVPELGLELPFGALGSPGNSPTRLAELLTLLDDTGKQVKPFSASLDARYDTLDNYRLLRNRGIAPVISLIHHKQESTPQAVAGKGVNLQGVPLAICGLPMRSNGFDKQQQRRSFVCGQQKGPVECGHCPYGPEHSESGQTRHASIKKFPRYVAEIPRHSPAWRDHYDRRTAAERTHGDLEQLTPRAVVQPRLRGVRKLAANAVLAHHFLLWHRVFNFIVDVTHLDELVGRHQSAVDEAVLVYGVASLHQLRDSHLRGVMPSHFT